MQSRPRLDGIDFLRGLVMAIMVLDHARDFFGGSSMNPRDVHDAGLFVTRWVTHFCAPIFVFLAGVSAFLYGNRGRTKAEVARFLLTRGLWLMIIELTVVRLAWTFNLSYDFVFMQVIWAIGCAMVALAALIYLPRWTVATFALTMIFGHNLLDGVQPDGTWRWLWVMTHSTGTLRPTPGMEIMAIYPLIPWVAVMAAGYALAPVFLQPEEQRRRTLLKIGSAVTVGFVVLRATNLYGDPAPWSVQDGFLPTVLSFINCEKYPPSLLYLAMTIGPGLILLGLFKDASSGLARVIVAIGRVPFLFYVAHIVLLHVMAVVVAHLTVGDIGWLFRHMPAFHKPEDYGLTLPAVYALWIVALALLYPMCRWFGALKQRRKEWWLSYL
ncbi:MAG TPA: heparan-alpha-glucosaminide N-acetyltransferase domain-containing protein [Steroidobacteraceae bacterium]|nr:heparan-alpha-glucosaminide N-acetyltransferase domain-containing protein [Steroidobacteraceae bacterium]